MDSKVLQIQKMGSLDDLPDLVLERIFRFLFAPRQNCHNINEIASMRALSKGLPRGTCTCTLRCRSWKSFYSNTCTRFRQVVESYDWKVQRLHIDASNLPIMRRKSSLLGTLANLISPKPKPELDLSSICWLGQVNFLRNVEISIDGFTPNQATYIVRKVSDGSKGL